MRALALTFATLAAPCWGADFRLSLPVDCSLGQDCYIQSYVDQDFTDFYGDFTCGGLSYNTHRGTDFALPDLKAMERGVSVLAAADGIVRATRDGMKDISVRSESAPDVSGRECGNAVVITHQDGWETQYCHLRRGSVAVKSNTSIKAGDKIGEIGLSGNTEFPHLHITVRKDGAVIDPFQPSASGKCGEISETLWNDNITYVAGGITSAGFSDGLPEFADIKAGTAGAATLTSNAPALVIWAQMFGGQRQDIVEFKITGPNGVFHETAVSLKRNQALLFRATGRKNGAGVLPPGTYVGEIFLYRDGDVLDRHQTEILIKR